MNLKRSKTDPWVLKSAPGTSELTLHTDERDGRALLLVCPVGSTVPHDDARSIKELLAMQQAAGDWVELGGADAQKPAKDGAGAACGRSSDNPIGGWYGLKKGLRGRFGVYIPPLMEAWACASWSTSRATTACVPSKRTELQRS